ncbi:CDP-alcohol phosphatidyltransferase family protein [Alkalibacterium putridalgicola]|uniref:Phosphatidylglycerophosphate synthase n=1 Tax=Alkalibacterium putridalgicola TaxID=426703 RepID=A0A1H7PYD1_9LACT|nr:CDP-alcohol phosphatidyltransferase family protein [Alkalibacterium putridalgicola]GEK88101.1 CDP-alcohol phosphatidyltransferase [Alkalibacterium putridalgicola]SEL40921.1 CDP-diacylglycerol--glycerol-3-phosphate 3-phosphatidyltransferase [Alkalibacterium putridalgicola]
MAKRDWFTIPNLLSYFRLILIPFFVYYYVIADTQADYMLATGILLISGITDAADGFIARKFNQGTKIGQLLDPIADKLTQIAVVAVLMMKWRAFIFLFSLFLIKETYMTVQNIRLYRKDKRLDGAEWYGKIATIVFYLTMFIAVFFPNLSDVTVTSLVVLASAYQLLAFFYYARLFKQMHKG